jgi:hypothetical protein
MAKSNNIDSLTIDDLERNIGRTEISAAFVSTLLFIGIFTAAIASQKIGFTPAHAGNDNLQGDMGKVGIYANVPETLGVKVIDKNKKNITYLVYGNSENGFSLNVAKSGEKIYSDNRMPGDGVIIKIPNIFDLITFSSYH